MSLTKFGSPIDPGPAAGVPAGRLRGGVAGLGGDGPPAEPERPPGAAAADPRPPAPAPL